MKGDLFRFLKPAEILVALEDVHFNIPHGITFGIIGSNGSGKSTLLKLIAGITKPSKGNIRVHGRVSALIELGAGFHPELTGRENIFINGIMLGLTREEVKKKMDEIIRFAELEEFIDQPVRTYSSGMFMRLGFSVAVHVNPEILLVDEVLAVGDEAFAHKCIDRMLLFKKNGKTIVLVTHALGLVEEFCDVAMWLKDGVVQRIGDPREVVGMYRMDVAQHETARIEEIQKKEQVIDEPVPEPEALEKAVQSFSASLEKKRWGDRTVEIVKVEFVGHDGKVSRVFPTGKPFKLRIKIHAHQDVTDFVFGIGIYTVDGIHVYGTNTDVERIKPSLLPAGEHVLEVDFAEVHLLEGSYFMDVAVHKIDGYPYDYHHRMHEFRIYQELPEVGVVRLPHIWRIPETIRMKKM